MEQIFSLLVDSRLLDLEDFKAFHQALGRECSIVNYVLSHEEFPCGQKRFNMWKTGIKESITQENLEPSVQESQRCLSEIEESVNRLNSNNSSQGKNGEILRDVVRTFQNMRFFQKDQVGYRILLRVLLALAKSKPKVGYCQGMNFVVAGVILGRLDPVVTGLNRENINNIVDIADSEVLQIQTEIFQFMSLLLHPQSKLCLAGLWGEKMPQMRLRVYQLDRLLRWTHPRLHQHFQQLQLSPELLTAQWLLTLFSYSIPLKQVLHLWDYLFITGWDGMFKISLSLLGCLQERLLEAEDTESVVLLLREWKKRGNLLPPQISVHQVIERGHVMVISHDVLLRLQENFARDMLALATLRQPMTEEEYFQEMGSENSKTQGSSSEKSLKPSYTSYLNNYSNDSNSVPNSPLSEKVWTYSDKHDFDEFLLQKRLKSMTPGDRPAPWLLRYAHKMTPKVVKELVEIQKELNSLELQVEQDKFQIQQKIVRSCDYHRESMEELTLAQEDTDYALLDLERTSEAFEIARVKARQLAESAEFYMQNPVAPSPNPLKPSSITQHTDTGSTSSTEQQQPSTTVVDDEDDDDEETIDFSKPTSRSSNPVGPTVEPTSRPTVESLDLRHDGSALAGILRMHSKEGVELSQQGPVGGDGTSEQRPVSLSGSLKTLTLFGTDSGEGLNSLGLNLNLNLDSRKSRSVDAGVLNRSSSGSGGFYSFSALGSSLMQKMTLSGDKRSLSAENQKKQKLFHQLEKNAQKTQKMIIEAHREFEEAKKRVIFSNQRLQRAKINEEEAVQWKTSLCDQLQLLVRDSNRGRSQKLLYVSEHYSL